MIWCETSTPDLDEARRFAEAIHREYPGKLLAYNCSPSFNWKKHLDEATIARFKRELAAMGYKFQFITLAGFHTLNYAMFELAYDYAREGMPATCACRRRSLPPWRRASRPCGISVRWAPATLTPCGR